MSLDGKNPEARVPAVESTLAECNATKDRLIRLDSHVRFEFDLTAQRLTYLAISESFLFSAYTIIQANAPKADGLNTYAQRIAVVLPWLGVALASASLLAVFGAISMTHILKDERGSIDDYKCGLGVNQRINTRCWQHWFGLVPPVVVPLAFLLGWLYIWIR